MGVKTETNILKDYKRAARHGHFFVMCLSDVEAEDTSYVLATRRRWSDRGTADVYAMSVASRLRPVVVEVVGVKVRSGGDADSRIA